MSVVAVQGMLYSRNFGDILLADIVARWLKAAGSTVVAPMASPSVATDLGLPAPRGKAEFLRQSRLVLTGGGYFGLSPKRPLRKDAAMVARYTLPAKAVTLRGGRYAIIGVGVSNLDHGPFGRYMRGVFDGAAVVSVRDTQSMAALRDIGVRRADVAELSDLALSLVPDQIPAQALADAQALLAPFRARHDRLIVLHISEPAATKGYGSVYEAIARFAAVNPDTGFVLVEDHPAGSAGGQTAAMQELAARIPGRTLEARYVEHWTLVALLSQIDGLITNKLHTAIVSSAFDKPAFAIAKHPKNHNFFCQIGYGERCVDLGGHTAIDLAAMAQRFLIDEAPATRLPDAIRDRARGHRALVEQFARS